MGEMVTFGSDGAATAGYLATAHEGAGLGLVVIEDRWGVADHIVDVCDRFAAEGFTALAPDLSRLRVGSAAPVVDMAQAAGELSGAVDFLQDHRAVRGHGVALVGFGPGGGLALWLATLRPDAVRAVVPFYGVAAPGGEPDWSALRAAVEGHFAEHDVAAGQDAVAALRERLQDLGTEARVFTYPGTSHGFFDDRRPGIYDEDAARQAWVRTLEFLRAKLG